MKKLYKIYKEAELVTERALKANFDINKPGKEFGVQDAAIIGLYEDMIGKVNSFIILLEHRSFNGVDSLTRMIFENYVFLKFILEKDSINRGKSYFYSLKIREIKFFKSMTEESMKGSEIRKYLSLTTEDLYKKFPDLINESLIREIEDNYVNSLNLKDKKQNWYNFNGKMGNLEILCKYLDLDREYFILYRTFSSEVHALEAMKNFKFKENILEVYKKGSDIKSNTNVGSHLLFDMIKDMYSYYNLKKDFKKFSSLMALNMNL